MGAKAHFRLYFMKEDPKLVKYHLDLSKQTDEAFMKEVEKIKKTGRRLSNHEKARLLRKARPLVYNH